MLSSQKISELALALLFAATTSLAAPAASTFILPIDGSKNLTFALNVPSGSQDLLFHISGPISNSWISIGTGDEMRDSLMFLLYLDQQGTNITLSPRLSTGNTEPVFEPSLAVDILPGSGIFQDTYILNAKCTNCRQWKSGSLDLKSTTQPWIYALGPHATMKSDSKSESIERHSEYGKFTMNMLQATGSAGLPTAFPSTIGAAESGAPTHDSNWTSLAHAVLMSLSFLMLMPLGVIFLRVFSRIRWHWVNQLLAAVIAILGVGVGIYLSSMYTKSQNYNSAHQLLGLVVTAFLFLQFFLGFWHHRIYSATSKSTPYASIHQYLGQILIIAGIVNGGIGLSWSRVSNAGIIAYSVAAVIAAAVTVALLVWKRMRNASNGGIKRRGGAGIRIVDDPLDESRSGSDINLPRYAQGPSYDSRSQSGVNLPGYTQAVTYTDRI